MKTDNKLRYITLTGLFAALITLFTAYFVHIPVGVNGGYVHIGDSLIYLGATILPLPYAMIAGAIGGGLADLLTAPEWALATVIIKMLIVLPFSSKNFKILCRRNVFAPVLAFVISAVGYYIADAVLFGTTAAFLVSVTSSFAQGLGSAIVYYVLGAALDKAGVKKLCRI